MVVSLWNLPTSVSTWGDGCWKKCRGREVVIEEWTGGDESRVPPHIRIGEGEWCYKNAAKKM